MNILLKISRFTARLLSLLEKYLPRRASGGKVLHTHHAEQLMRQRMIMGPMPLLFEGNGKLAPQDWGNLDYECTCSDSNFPDIILVDSDCPRHGYQALLDRAMQRAAEDNALISRADLIRRTSRAEARLRAQRARYRRFPND